MTKMFYLAIIFLPTLSATSASAKCKEVSATPLLEMESPSFRSDEATKVFEAMTEQCNEHRSLWDEGDIIHRWNDKHYCECTVYINHEPQTLCYKLKTSASDLLP